MVSDLDFNFLLKNTKEIILPLSRLVCEDEIKRIHPINFILRTEFKQHVQGIGS
jgi:hypothetical protein